MQLADGNTEIVKALLVDSRIKVNCAGMKMERRRSCMQLAEAIQKL